MLDWQAIEKAWADWAMARSGLNAAHVRFAYGEAVIPARPLLTMTWVERDVPIGASAADNWQAVLDDPDATQVFNHVRQHTLQIDWFALIPQAPNNHTSAPAGADASAALGNLVRSLQLDSVRRSFLSAGVGINTISGVRDLTRIVETEYEGRASVDVTFQTTDTTFEQAYKITTVDPPSGTVHFG